MQMKKYLTNNNLFFKLSDVSISDTVPPSCMRSPSSPTAMNAYIPYIIKQAGRQAGGGGGSGTEASCVLCRAEWSKDVMGEENSEIFQVSIFRMFCTIARLQQAQCRKYDNQ